MNARASDDSTALASASKRGYTKVIKVLIKAGADVNAKFEVRATTAACASLPSEHIIYIHVPAPTLTPDGRGRSLA